MGGPISNISDTDSSVPNNPNISKKKTDDFNRQTKKRKLS